jgi:hypothetical protein
MTTSRFDRIRNSPALYPGVAASLGPGFPWHVHAGSPRSSQALCLSAWYPLREAEARHEVVKRLLVTSLPAIPPRAGRRWEISVEVSRPELLAEGGGQPSSIDVLLLADDAAVCVESKYLSDALAGFGRCSQFPNACRGFYGPGSDLKTESVAPCRLSVADGRREARRYWTVAERLFRNEALGPSREPGSCVLNRSYQLARTLFFAAELARTTNRPHFGALGIAPAATAEVIEAQVATFSDHVLLREHAGRVGVAHYERLVKELLESGDEAAAAVGRFVASRLPAPPAPRRTQTARELRKQAEAERKARLRTSGQSRRRTSPGRAGSKAGDRLRERRKWRW